MEDVVCMMIGLCEVEFHLLDVASDVVDRPVEDTKEGRKAHSFEAMTALVVVDLADHGQIVPSADLFQVSILWPGVEGNSDRLMADVSKTSFSEEPIGLFVAFVGYVTSDIVGGIGQILVPSN